jgi:hypothetical protein
MEYHRDNLLEKLNMLTVHIKCRHPGALFLIDVCSGAKCCPSVLEAVGIRVSTRNIRVRNFTTFICSSSHCLSATGVGQNNGNTTDTVHISL